MLSYDEKSQVTILREAMYNDRGHKSEEAYPPFVSSIAIPNGKWFPLPIKWGMNNDHLDDLKS